MDSGELISERWQWSGPVGWGLATALVVLLMIASWQLQRRGQRHLALPERLTLFSLRSLSWMLLGWMLLGGVAHRIAVDRPTVIVIVDDSQSMQRAAQVDEPTTTKAQRKVTGAESSTRPPTRWQVAQRILTQLPEEFWERQRIVVGGLHGTAQELPSAAAVRQWLLQHEPQADRSPLGLSVQRRLREYQREAVSGILLLSDTQDTGEPDLLGAESAILESRVPLYALNVARIETAPRWQVVRLEYPRRCYLGETALVDVMLEPLGTMAQDLEVALVNSDTGEVWSKERVVVSPPDKQPAALPEAAPARTTAHVSLALPIRDPGRRRFHLAAWSRPNQPTAAANVLEGAQLGGEIDVLDRPTRVLLLDSSPRYEVRYLQNLLSRLHGPAQTSDNRAAHASFQLTTLLLDADPDWYEQQRPLIPGDVEAWNQYDVVILGDVAPSQIPNSALESLRTWLSEYGGSIVLIAGPQHLPSAYEDSPLRDLLPFATGTSPSTFTTSSEAISSVANGVTGDAGVLNPLENYRWRLTELGASTPFARLVPETLANQSRWEAFTPLDWLVGTAELKPAVNVIVEAVAGSTTDQPPALPASPARSIPLICWYHVGLGRVVWHGTDELWRWRFRRDETEYAQYWSQLLRFLSQSQGDEPWSIDLTSNRQIYPAATPVVLTATMAAANSMLSEISTLPMELTVDVKPLSEPAPQRAAANPAPGPSEPSVIPPPPTEERRLMLARLGNEPQVWRGQLSDLAPGHYRAELVADQIASPGASAERAGTVGSCEFMVEPEKTEARDVPLPVAPLKKLALASGGRYWSADELADVWSHWPNMARPAGRHVSTRNWWNAWPVPFVLLLSLGLEWYLRQRWNATW